jgi:ABC-type Fe3+-siderophore transport system permease subunit
MAISGKVTASTVAAAGTTIVAGIVAPHVFSHSVPSDVRGLIEGGVTAVLTFVSGYLAKHGISYERLAADTAAVAEDLGVPYMALSDVTAEPAPVVSAGPGSVAVGGDIVGSVVTGEAQPIV